MLKMGWNRFGIEICSKDDLVVYPNFDQFWSVQSPEIISAVIQIIIVLREKTSVKFRLSDIV